LILFKSVETVYSAWANNQMIDNDVKFVKRDYVRIHFDERSQFFIENFLFFS